MTDSNTFAAVPNTCAKVYNVVSTVGILSANTINWIASSAFVKDVWSEVYNDGNYQKKIKKGGMLQISMMQE